MDTRDNTLIKYSETKENPLTCKFKIQPETEPKTEAMVFEKRPSQICVCFHFLSQFKPQSNQAVSRDFEIVID